MSFHVSRMSKLDRKSFGILYAKVILYNFADEHDIQEIQDGGNAVSHGVGGDISGCGGVKQCGGVYYLI